MAESNLKSLEGKVDDLIRLCTNMKRENQRLREEQQALQVERTNLINKNQLARSRLEKVLSRLKSMQQEP